MKSKLYSLDNHQNDDDGDFDDISTKTFSVSLRNAFIPYKNGILLSADYCQLELRIIAHLCKDKLLQKIINNNDIDVFKSLASEWLNVAIERVDEIQRQQTKQVENLILYSKNISSLYI
jgi:DNA polymerase I-like protein with 3'-5' exonuclease and polymerase domains